MNLQLINRLLKVHMHKILQFVFHIFLASFNNRQDWGPEFKQFFKIKSKSFPYNWIFMNTALSPKNATFHSTYSLKPHNSISSLKMLYTAKSAQFNSALLLKMRSLTRLFAENAQYNLKTHNWEDSGKFHFAFSATMISYAMRFQRKRGVIKNFKYLGKFEKDFWKCWLYCVLYLLVNERCKNKFKNRIWKSCAYVPLSFLNSKGYYVPFIESH